MLTKVNITDLIYDGLKELNAGRTPEHKIPLRTDTKLLGSEGLGSLEVVELVVKLEDELTLQLNRQVKLTHEQLLSEAKPLRDVESLAAFLESTFFN